MLRLDDASVHRAIAWAAVLVAAGNKREAIDFLERARVHTAHLRFHLNEPRFDAIRDDARFQQLMLRLRVPKRPAD